MHEVNMMDDDENDAFQQPPSASTMLSTLIKIDVTYVTNTWIGRVKVLELLFITLAGCILPSAIGFFFTRFSFYTFVVWTCFMYIFIDLMIHITSISRLLPKMCATSGIMIYPLAIGAFALLISCSLVAGVADLFPGSSRTTRTGFSVAFGFIVMILFIVEAVLHHLNTKKPKHAAGSDYEDDDSDIEQPPQGRASIVISRPIVRALDNPPPYEKNGVSGGGEAMPVGGYS